MVDAEFNDYSEFRDIIFDITNRVPKIKYTGDLSDIGNEIGMIIAKYLNDDKIGDLESFIDGLRHGVSLIDGTHDNPVVVESKYDKAVEYVQENYVNRDGHSFLLLGNVAELIDLCTGQFIAWTELEKYKKS